MIWHPRAGTTPIGLDIGSRYIKAAQLRLAAKPRLESAMILERRHNGVLLEADEARRLSEVLHRHGFAGRRVVAAVPRQALLTSVMELPARAGDASPNELTELAEGELARTHRRERGGVEVACWRLPPSSRRHEGVPVMAAGCPHDAAEALLDTLEAVGLDVMGLDLQGWALLRACQSLLPAEAQLVAAVDVGWQSITLVLLHEHTLIYERLLGGAGLEVLTESLQREHHLEPAVSDYLLARCGVDEQAIHRCEQPALAGQVRAELEAHFQQVVQELRLSLSYASQQYPEASMNQLLLTGGGAAIPGLAAYLAQLLDVQVQAVLPEQVAAIAPGTLPADAGPALMTAMGLARYPQEVLA